MWPHAAIQGRVWATRQRGEEDKDFQGQVGFAALAAKNSGFVISYFGIFNKD